MEAFTVLGSKHFESVIGHRFVCLTHSEAKQTKMSEFGAEKGLLQGTARQVAHAVKIPELPTGFQHCIFKGQVRESGLKISLRTCLTG